MECEEIKEIINQESVLMKVAGLYANHLLSDIELIVGGTKYPAHRVILSASSEVFQCMLLNPQWSESKESTIHLMEDAKASEVFPQFLKFLYTGQTKISPESAMPLLSLADKYNIKDLIVLCQDYMTKSIAVAAQRGVFISWLQYTILPAHQQQLNNELKNFLRLNIETVGFSKDFVDLDPNNLCILLQQNDLVVQNELKLFEIVERYALQKIMQIETEESLSDEEKKNDIKALIEGIFPYIRYPMMTIQELATLPLRKITSLSKEFFCDCMAIGMSFHANQLMRVNNDYMQCTPRLYLSDQFCIELAIPEIHQVENYKTFSACFFSLEEFPYSEGGDESHSQWEIDFFPRGIRFNSAQLINVYTFPAHQGAIELPESILRTVRLRCTSKIFAEETRFKIAVVVSGCQNNITYFKTLHTRISYFSRENRVINFDNLIPFEEIDLENTEYLIGKKRNMLRIHVIITPYLQLHTQDSPSFDLK